jgi:hypothetical protein
MSRTSCSVTQEALLNHQYKGVIPLPADRSMKEVLTPSMTGGAGVKACWWSDRTYSTAADFC